MPVADGRHCHHLFAVVVVVIVVHVVGAVAQAIG